MTYPEDPQRWGQQQPDGGSGDQRPQEPVTGPTVSYNAADFDDETRVDHPLASENTQQSPPPSPGSQQTPFTGAQPQAPFTGAQPQAPFTGAQQPFTGAQPQPPLTGPQQAPITGPQQQPPITGSHQAPAYAADGYGVQPGYRAEGHPNENYPNEGYPNEGYPTGGHPTETYPAAGYSAGSYPTETYPAHAQPGPDAGGYPATGPQPAYGPPPGGYPPAGGYESGVTPFDPGPRKRSNKPLLLGLGALVLVGALVAGYFVFFTFGGIQNSKGEIKNAASFLGEAQTEWKSQLPEDGIKVSDKASCYFVLDDDDEVTEQIACGPARRASTPQGAVWDMYAYSVTGSGDSQTATELVAGDTSQQAPGSGSLVTVEGDEPEDDGLGLEEPPLPKAPSKAVQAQGSFEVGEKSLGKENALVDSPMLIGPKAQIQLSSVQEATSATIDETLMAPAEGEKFYVVTLEGGAGPVDQDADNSLELTIDGESVEVSGDPATLGQTSFLFSVPEDADATLDLVSAGHRQSLALANGERTTDETTSMYYSSTPEINTPISATASMPQTTSDVGESMSLEFTFSSGWIYPYDEKLGWAPEGEVWVQLDFKDSGTVHTPNSPYTQYLLDCMATTFDVGGTIHTCPGPSASAPLLVASVPAGTTSFTMNLAATTTITGSGVPDGKVTFTPVAVQIKLA